MALFQRKIQDGSKQPLYTLGQQKNILIVGLGNPGEDFINTRHNIGFACVDDFVQKHDLGTWITKRDLKCQIVTGTLGDARLIIIKPQTFMNLSGASVHAVINYYKLNPHDVVVVHDELDIPFGQIRARSNGSAAGHNGIKSVIDKIGEEFGRVRIGIANEQSPKYDSADFVLKKFNDSEIAQIDNLKKEVSAIISEYIFSGSLATETRTFIV